MQEVLSEWVSSVPSAVRGEHDNTAAVAAAEAKVAAAEAKAAAGAP